MAHLLAILCIPDNYLVVVAGGGNGLAIVVETPYLAVVMRCHDPLRLAISTKENDSSFSCANEQVTIHTVYSTDHAVKLHYVSLSHIGKGKECHISALAASIKDIVDSTDSANIATLGSRIDACTLPTKPLVDMTSLRTSVGNSLFIEAYHTVRSQLELSMNTTGSLLLLLA